MTDPAAPVRDSSTYPGHVYAPKGPGSGSGGEGYYATVDELLDKCVLHGVAELPTMYVVLEQSPTPPKAESLIDDILEDTFDGAYDNVPAEKVEEMREFLTRWCNTCGVRVWRATNVELPPAPAHVEAVARAVAAKAVR